MMTRSQTLTLLTSDLTSVTVMWPFTSFGAIASGGVSLGNIKLEVVEANSTAPWCIPQPPPRIAAVAFRPSTTVDGGYLTELDRRGIGHTPPEHFERDGRPAWTNVYFTDLVSRAAGGFVCDYHLLQPRDLVLRRRVLQDCDGGRLGVLHAVELVITTTDAAAASRRWQRLLDPLQPAAPLVWRPTVGPALRLVSGAQEQVDHLALAVHSTDLAEQRWRQVASMDIGELPLEFTAASDD
jgi:hypothetical protein